MAIGAQRGGHVRGGLLAHASAFVPVRYLDAVLAAQGACLKGCDGGEPSAVGGGAHNPARKIVVDTSLVTCEDGPVVPTGASHDPHRPRPRLRRRLLALRVCPCQALHLRQGGRRQEAGELPPPRGRGDCEVAGRWPASCRLPPWRRCSAWHGQTRSAR